MVSLAAYLLASKSNVCIKDKINMLTTCCFSVCDINRNKIAAVEAKKLGSTNQSFL